LKSILARHVHSGLAGAGQPEKEASMIKPTAAAMALAMILGRNARSSNPPNARIAAATAYGVGQRIQ
jgi:hypothetical protein